MATIKIKTNENYVPWDFPTDMMADFELMKPYICYTLINRKRNKALLADAPFLHFQDLAIVFHILVSEGKEEMATVTVKNTLMQLWGITDVSRLYTIAHRNMQKRFKGRIYPLLDVLKEMISGKQGDMDAQMANEPLPESDAGVGEMFIATNSMKLNGSSVILYDDILKQFARNVGGDFYILPSSVHELIFLQANDAIDAGDLAAMVQEINETQVSPDEVLSDNVYRYYAKDSRMDIM